MKSMSREKCRLTLVVFLLLSLTIGCATSQKELIPEKVEVATLGIKTDKAFEVLGFYHVPGLLQSPAKKAGIEVGDILRAVEGIPLESHRQLRELILKKNPGETISLSVERRGKPLSFDVALGSRNIPYHTYIRLPMLWTLEDLVNQGDPVRLSVIIGEISADIKNKYELKKWRRSAEAEILAYYENGLTKLFKQPNFFLIDSHMTEEILKGEKPSVAGSISQEMHTKLGEMLDLTHIMIIDYSRTREEDKTRDTETLRLIEVETGRVLESLTVVPRLRYDYYY
jgi:hypothetical protein